MLDLPFEPPVQQIHLDVFEKNGVDVFIKREDLIHPFISGNKWRKLKYVLADAQDTNKNHLVSFGGAYSNHLLALACAGAMYGFKTTAFVRGEEVQNHMLHLCKLYGMHLQFVSREAYKNKSDLFHSHFSKDTSAYFIDEGGKGILAAKGCEEILDPIQPNEFDYVVCATGTGTTLAGMAVAAKRLGITAEGICVLKGALEMDNEVENLAGFPVKIHHEFHRGGYAKTDEALLSFISSFAQQTGILLDQVYTAKMVLAVMSLTENNYYRKGDKILLIHTGGILGLLSQV